MQRLVSVSLLLALALLLPLGPLRPATAEEAAEAGEPGVPDAALQEKINRAIEQGALWLESKQSPNGSFGGIITNNRPHHEIGTTSLAALALLAAGRERVAPKPGDDGRTSVDHAFQYLVNRDMIAGSAGSRSTYDGGVLLMFVTKYWRGAKEGKRANPCHLPKGNPRNPKDPSDPNVKQWVQDLTAWLVRVAKKPMFTWGYPAHRDDHSNTQYAFLGLRAARDCGAKIAPQVFLQAAQTVMERQQQDGPVVQRVIPGPEPGSKYVVGKDRARGWGYLPQPEVVATGSMTTAGIAILAICHDALTRPKRVARYDAKFESRLRRSVQDGFAWLDMHWTIKRNPGPGAPNWHYYYLYGLERACVFGVRNLIGLHDWYIEGARYLVGKQQEDGRWETGFLGDETYEPNPIVDTAWAILFLARATRPLPKPVPVVTESD